MVFVTVCAWGCPSSPRSRGGEADAEHGREQTGSDQAQAAGSGFRGTDTGTNSRVVLPAFSAPRGAHHEIAELE